MISCPPVSSLKEGTIGPFNSDKVPPLGGAQGGNREDEKNLNKKPEIGNRKTCKPTRS